MEGLLSTGPTRLDFIWSEQSNNELVARLWVDIKTLYVLINPLSSNDNLSTLFSSFWYENINISNISRGWTGLGTVKIGCFPDCRSFVQFGAVCPRWPQHSVVRPIHVLIRSLGFAQSRQTHNPRAYTAGRVILSPRINPSSHLGIHKQINDCWIR